MNYIKSQTALNEFNIGAIDGYDERERLIQDKNSQYKGLEEKTAEELVPPDSFTTPDNRNGSGGSNPKKPSSNIPNDSSQNSAG